MTTIKVVFKRMEKSKKIFSVYMKIIKKNKYEFS